jgi:hypothetical protein
MDGQFSPAFLGILFLFLGAVWVVLAQFNPRTSRAFVNLAFFSILVGVCLMIQDRLPQEVAGIVNFAAIVLWAMSFANMLYHVGFKR